LGPECIVEEELDTRWSCFVQVGPFGRGGRVIEGDDEDDADLFRFDNERVVWHWNHHRNYENYH